MGRPWAAESNRLEQIDVWNEAGQLVAVGLYIDDVNVLLAEGLYQPMADWSLLDQERGLSVPLLYVDDLLLKLVEWKLAANDFKHVVQIATVDEYDTGRIMPGFLLAECNIPAQNNPVGRPTFDCGIVPQHFPLDDLAAGRFGGRLVLGRKTHRAHALLDIPQYFGGLMGGMQQIALFASMGAAGALWVAGRRVWMRYFRLPSFANARSVLGQLGSPCSSLISN
jgi:hypothetical protein